MERYRFVFAPRWIGLTLAGAVVMVVCVLLSNWQWGRAVERAAANEVIEAGGEAVPIDLTLPAGRDLADGDRWTLVEAVGVYDADAELVLRAQTNNGLNGFEIVTPLVLADGTAVLVDRGFIASEGTGSVPDFPAPPAGEVAVTGRLYESEPEGGSISEVDGRMESRRLSLEMLADRYDYELRDAWVADIEPAEGFTALETPSFKDWQNYSYAAQWMLFAALVPLGWIALARRERRDLDAAEADDDADDEAAPPAEAGEAALVVNAEVANAQVVDAQPDRGAPVTPSPRTGSGATEA